MAELEIIGLPISTYVRAVRIAALEKGVTYTLVPAAPHSEPVNRISPAGRIPVMRHGDVELAESRAIAGYIDTVFDGPKLFPADPVEAAKAEQWISLTNTVLDPLFIRRYLFAYIFPKSENGALDRAAIDTAVEEMRPLFQAVDTALAATGYFAGSAPGFADWNLFTMLHYLRQMPESGEMLNASPNLLALHDRLAARESAKATLPPPPQEAASA
ncbi:hypothetical protein GR183_01010 [Stappia sp. GBMRC 2046]|uniref:Glutathione S-transferase n=1 Tax=Stappia sediminis TaxID=2692190 RepID=A0A7X3LQZ4_9HYPH|nr:glutathione S-transferase family protein [Stappia sediminis]MXN63470.1 hypothetical protein [Stappia sediminis]